MRKSVQLEDLDGHSGPGHVEVDAPSGHVVSVFVAAHIAIDAHDVEDSQVQGSLGAIVVRKAKGAETHKGVSMRADGASGGARKHKGRQNRGWESETLKCATE
jgi:hypothetical protein